MICYVSFVFYILLSYTGCGEGATVAYDPADVFLINCGETRFVEMENNGRNWTWDSSILPFSDLVGDTSLSSKILPSNSVNASDIPLVPYKTARIFLSDFTYRFPVSPGCKFIRLYFYPTRYTTYTSGDFDVANSFFYVNVNGFALLKNFSAGLTAKANNETFLIKEFVVPVYQGLNLTFTPSLNSLAFINGVEIVSMPDNLYSKRGLEDRLQIEFSPTYLDGDYTSAFETVYRLNVGGDMVSDVNDTGMFRRWLSDNDFFVSKNSEEVEPGVKISYSKKTPAYVAPEYVYQTSRTMGNVNNPRVNLKTNLTWLFTVDAGFIYLVRLHFCETLPAVNQRVFSIFIDHQIAKPDVDVIALSGGSGIPMYLDFGAYVGSDNGPRPDLRLDLHPYKDAEPFYYDAILNGVEILKLNNLPGGNTGGPNPNNTTLGGNSHVPLKTPGHKRIVTKILIAVGSAIGLVPIIVLLMLLMRRTKRKKNRQNNSVAMFKVLLKHYTYAEVKKITKSFSHTIGKGGFGTVYGGILTNGRKVAVKVLKDSKGNGEDFINEVASMSQTSHVNIVSLLGFCYEGSKRAIVYEFLENGSLDQFISKKKPLTLDVTTLYGIALGIARGLEYLHYGCKTRIVHFDIKPQNVLLDNNLCPKVSDFGLAKLCETRESIVSLMDTRGTIGYIAPEVFSRMYGGISHKSDVYSYGMLVLEMIGARSKDMVETTASDANSSYFPDWIYKDLENGEQTWIPGDEVTEEEKEIAKKMILVSLWCIQPCPVDRPPMNRVVEMIEGSLDVLEIPPKPSMHISRGFVADQSSSLPSLSHGEEEAGEKTKTSDSTNI